ncbi:hypothetical protein BaRGS_00022434, partial [Batillaria attramentaria]
ALAPHGHPHRCRIEGQGTLCIVRVCLERTCEDALLDPHGLAARGHGCAIERLCKVVRCSSRLR